MSLICARCGKTGVVSNHPDHYMMCAACGVNNMTEAEKKLIEVSSISFRKRDKK